MFAIWQVSDLSALTNPLPTSKCVYPVQLQQLRHYDIFRFLRQKTFSCIQIIVRIAKSIQFALWGFCELSFSLQIFCVLSFPAFLKQIPFETNSSIFTVSFTNSGFQKLLRRVEVTHFSLLCETSGGQDLLHITFLFAFEIDSSVNAKKKPQPVLFVNSVVVLLSIAFSSPV